MNSAEVLITFKGDTSGVESATKQVGDSLESLKKKGQVALTGITTALDTMTVKILKGGIAYNGQIETYLTRLETLTGSAEEANAVLDRIKQDALKTPFDVSSLTQAESLLLATGMGADNARADILALGDAISASGGGNEELQRMAVNLQQIKNVGKASALDIKQFAYAGIDIYGLLADSMGVTRKEASQMDVTYEMLSEALKKASSQGGKYYGAMEKQSKTYNGAMSNLNESIEVLKGELARDLFNAIKKLIPILNKFVDWLGKNYKIIKAIAIPLLVFFNTLMLLKSITLITTLVKGLWLAMTANPIFLIIAGITALVATIAYLWNNCEAFRNAITSILNFIGNIVKTTGTAIRLAITGIISFIRVVPGKILGFFVSLPGKMFNIAKDIFNKFKSGLSQVWTTIKTWIQEKVVDKIIGMFNFFDAMVQAGKDLIEGIKKGIKDKWDSFKGWVSKKANDIKGFFKNPLGIHSPSKFMQDEIGKNLVLGLQVGYDKNVPKLKSGIENSIDSIKSSVDSAFQLSPTLVGNASTHLSPNINVNVINNMKTDPLGQVVSNIKTFSGGAKNDYNYGYGG